MQEQIFLILLIFYEEKTLKSLLLAGFVFLALFSFWSFSSSFYCAKSFSEFEERWHKYVDEISKNHLLRDNIQSSDIEIRKAVARKAMGLEESSLNTIQILSELVSDSTLPVLLREEIKSRILFHAQKVSGKVISEDLSPEQTVIEFKKAVARKALAESSTKNFYILKDMAIDSTLPVPLREVIKSRILFHAREASREFISEDVSVEQADIVRASMVVLRKLGGSAAMDFMKSFRNHPYSQFREYAVFFTSDNKDANEVIELFLNDPNPAVQDELVKASVEAGNKSALQELLKSSDIIVRKRAEAGLKVLQSAEDSVDIDSRYSSYYSLIRTFKDDSEILKGVADRLLVNDGVGGMFDAGYSEIIDAFSELFIYGDSHKFLHLDPEGVVLHLVQRIGDMKKNYAEAMIMFFEGGGSYDGRSAPPGVRELNAKIKQTVLEGMKRKPSKDLIELAGNKYFHEPFNGDKTSQKTIIQMANRRGGPFQERIFNHYTTTPYWRSFPEVDEMIVAGLKQVKVSDWNDSYQNVLTNLVQKYKDDTSSTIAEELRALKKS